MSVVTAWSQCVVVLPRFRAEITGSWAGFVRARVGVVTGRYGAARIAASGGHP